jgi:hypothetical protein
MHKVTEGHRGEGLGELQDFRATAVNGIKIARRPAASDAGDTNTPSRRKQLQRYSFFILVHLHLDVLLLRLASVLSDTALNKLRGTDKHFLRSSRRTHGFAPRRLIQHGLANNIHHHLHLLPFR